MKWDDCIEYKVKKVKGNPEQAKALFQLAKRRLESIKKRRKDEYPQFLIEAYYETIKELISSLLSIHGYKSYSHECLVVFIKEYYPDFLDDSQLHFLDSMRKLRSDIQGIVDMPDNKIDRMIIFLHQNTGKLASRKRKFFPELKLYLVGSKDEWTQTECLADSTGLIFRTGQLVSGDSEEPYGIQQTGNQCRNRERSTAQQ